MMKVLVLLSVLTLFLGLGAGKTYLIETVDKRSHSPQEKAIFQARRSSDVAKRRYIQAARRSNDDTRRRSLKAARRSYGDPAPIGYPAPAQPVYPTPQLPCIPPPGYPAPAPTGYPTPRRPCIPPPSWIPGSYSQESYESPETRESIDSPESNETPESVSYTSEESIENPYPPPVILPTLSPYPGENVEPTYPTPAPTTTTPYETPCESSYKTCRPFEGLHNPPDPYVPLIDRNSIESNEHPYSSESVSYTSEESNENPYPPPVILPTITPYPGKMVEPTYPTPAPPTYPTPAPTTTTPYETPCESSYKTCRPFEGLHNPPDPYVPLIDRN